MSNSQTSGGAVFRSEFGNSLRHIASLSAETEVMSQDLMDTVHTVELEELRAKLAELNQQVARLSIMWSSENEEQQELSDTEIAQLLADFSKFAPKASPKDLLSTYTQSFFLQYQPDVRIQIASRLVDIAYARKFEPAAVWKSVVARQGYL